MDNFGRLQDRTALNPGAVAGAIAPGLLKPASPRNSSTG